jgi:hypothetical protein
MNAYDGRGRRFAPRAKHALAVLVTMTAACGGGRTLDEGERAWQEEAALTPPIVGPSCKTLRYVASNEAWIDAGCPAVSGWHSGWLFDPTEVHPLPDYAPPTPRALRAYCLFKWSEGSATATPTYDDVKVLSTFASNAAADCGIVSPVDDSPTQLTRDPIANAPEIYNPLWTTAQRQISAATTLPLRSKRQRVRVAVVDTAPRPQGGYVDGEPASPPRSTHESVHGPFVGRLVRALACPGGANDPACAGYISNHLALPRYAPFKTDYKSGGRFGTVGEAAVATWNAVTDWANDASDPSKSQQALVVNLSVGWVPQGNAAEDAVRDAIRYARCMGALPVAAAGNRTREPSVGALLPAAWEASPAPTPAECKKDFEIEPPIKNGKYAPLVYAAAGVDAGDRPLVNARPGSRPRLAAYAFAVTVPQVGTVLPNTATLTGSSVAAAVASGSAAVVWSLEPTLAADDVMGLLYGTGIDLSSTANICLDRPCREHVRRISLCGALQSICRDGACSTFACTAPVPAYTGSLDPWQTSWTALAPDLQITSSATPCPPSGCGAPGSFAMMTDVPWAGPQPGGTGCDVCSIERFNSVALLDVALSDGVFEQPRPNVTGVLTAISIYGGEQSYQFDLPPPPSRHFQVKLPNLTDGTTTATVSFNVAGGAPGLETSEAVIVR